MESIAGKLIAAFLKRGLVVVFCSTVIGCVTSQPLYYWGNYEEIIYQMYIKPGSADPGSQVQKLKEDVDKASSEGKLVPPGLHAHLGYMYFLQGNTHDALLEFAAEKKLFPESAKFVDGFTGRVKK